jgi:hypothetical protein
MDSIPTPFVGGKTSGLAPSPTLSQYAWKQAFDLENQSMHLDEGGQAARLFVGQMTMKLI